MNDSIPELLRVKSVEHLFTTKSMNDAWPVWKKDIKKLLGKNISPQDILDLGDHLSDIFKKTRISGRGQATLSGGGNAWESLICWYLNLCFVGSRAVAFKKNSLVPSPLTDSITLNMGNFVSNTESDIIVVVFPNCSDFNNSVNLVNYHKTKIDSNNNLVKDFLTHVCQKNFNSFELGTIQCKTNWNDNAQIPMLWDIIYSYKNLPNHNITIGRNGYTIGNLHKFTYSFVTVPTNNVIYSPNSVAVKRVSNLSGGNYWGNSTKKGIARSIKEIMNNFNNAFNGGVITSITNSLNDLTNNNMPYFRL